MQLQLRKTKNFDNVKQKEYAYQKLVMFISSMSVNTLEINTFLSKVDHKNNYETFTVTPLLENT